MLEFLGIAAVIVVLAFVSGAVGQLLPVIGWKGVWTTLGVMILGVGLFFLTRARLRERARFDAAAKAFIEDSSEWRGWPAPEQPTIRGKLLFVDASSKRLDRFYYSLSPELRPKSPTDFGTVAILRCSAVLAGKYEEEGPGASHLPTWVNGYQWVCDVEVIDPAAHTRFASEPFRGSMPPEHSALRSDRWGSKPMTAVRRFLAALPRDGPGAVRPAGPPPERVIARETVRKSAPAGRGAAATPDDVVVLPPAELAARRIGSEAIPYPEIARVAHITGTVVLEVLVGEDGRVLRASARSGHPLLAEGARRAVLTWRYRPLVVQGRSVRVSSRVVGKVGGQQQEGAGK